MDSLFRLRAACTRTHFCAERLPVITCAASRARTVWTDTWDRAARRPQLTYKCAAVQHRISTAQVFLKAPRAAEPTLFHCCAASINYLATLCSTMAGLFSGLAAAVVYQLNWVLLLFKLKILVPAAVLENEKGQTRVFFSHIVRKFCWVAKMQMRIFSIQQC